MRSFGLWCIICAFTLLSYEYVCALPQGAEVVHGDVHISQYGTQAIIDASHNSIINYQSFDVAAHEQVTFIQPDSHSRVLNRIQSATPTHIDGSLQSNGIIYLVNPAGIIFSENAVIDVGAIIAAAAGISDRMFTLGIDTFTDLSSEVTHRGQIHAKDFVYFIGNKIINSGNIITDGKVSLFVAEKNQLLIGKIEGHTFLAINSNIEIPDDDLISSKDFYSLAIQHSGKIKASEVVLHAFDSNIELQGSIDVTHGLCAAGKKRSLCTNRPITGPQSDPSDITFINKIGGNISIFGKRVNIKNAESHS